MELFGVLRTMHGLREGMRDFMQETPRDLPIRRVIIVLNVPELDEAFLEPAIPASGAPLERPPIKAFHRRNNLEQRLDALLDRRGPHASSIHARTLSIIPANFFFRFPIVVGLTFSILAISTFFSTSIPMYPVACSKIF